jgi:hypothetical protein
MSRKDMKRGKDKYDSDDGQDSDSDIDEPIDDDEKTDPIEHVRNLCKLCKYILRLYDKDNGIVRKGRRSPILQMVYNYTKGVEGDVCFDLYIEEYFNIFKSHKKDILSDNHEWLLDNDIVIRHGTTKGKTYKYRHELPVSDIYRKCGELYEKHVRDKISKEGGKNIFSFFPNRLRRAVYLVFIETTTSSTIIDKMGLILNDIEESLGIEDGTYVEDFGTGLGLFSGGGLKGGFESILKLVLKSAKDNGMSIPNGMGDSGFDFSKITNILGTLFDGDKGFMSSIMNDVAKCKDHKEIGAILIDKLKDPETLKKLSDALGTDIPVGTLTDAIEKNRSTIDKMFEGSYGKIMEEAIKVSTSPSISVNTGVIPDLIEIEEVEDDEVVQEVEDDEVKVQEVEDDEVKVQEVEDDEVVQEVKVQEVEDDEVVQEVKVQEVEDDEVVQEVKVQEVEDDEVVQEVEDDEVVQEVKVQEVEDGE